MTFRTRLLVFLFMSFSIAFHANAQVDVSKIIPPSPNSAALAKFADQPVNVHTGIPTIDIPVYSWSNSNAGLSLNIGLNYHAGGVKVEEQASSVGLGWALNAGGVITRTMRSRPDEGIMGFKVTAALPDVATSTYDGDFVRVNPYYNQNYAINSSNSTAYDELANLSNNYQDALQDIFVYSFNGRSGKFYLGKDGSVLLQNKENLKISLIQTPGVYRINAFEIVDEQGVLYHFEELETTQVHTETLVQNNSGITNSDNTDNPYDSSWYLSYIKSADRQSTVSFTYQTSHQTYRTGFSESKSIDLGFYTNATVPDEETISSYNTLIVEGKRLSQISFPDNISVSFGYSTQLREDLENDYALKTITITDNFKTRGYNLVQSYANTGGDSYVYNNKRLMLDQLTEFGGSNQENPYQFLYTGGLPPKNSMMQDFWGYAIADGRTINSRIPKFDLPPAAGPYANRMNFVLDGSDRSPDSIGVKGASLRKIIYPTGGSTVYDMEINNSFSPYYNLNRVKKSFSITKSGANVGQGVEVVPSAVLSATVQLSVVETSRTTPEPGSTIGYIEEDIDNNPVTITLYKGSWSSVIYSGTYGQVRSQPYFIVNNLALPETGVYNIQMQMSTIYPIDFNATFTVLYDIAPTNKPVGGLRVKQVKSYLSTDEQSQPALVKVYDYNLTDGKSSGKLSTVPSYRYYNITKITSDASGPGWNGFYHNMLTRNSSSTQPLGAIQGSPVGYARVTVKSISPTQALGKTVYEFTPLLYTDEGNVLPFKSGEYISWAAGLPLKETVYNNDGLVVKSTESTYAFTFDKFISSNHRSLVIGKGLTDQSGSISSYNTYAVQQSYPIIGNSLKTRQVDRLYSGSNYVEQVTDYTYDGKFQNKTVTLNNSSGTKTTKYFYSYDYTGVPVFATMAAANRISAAVKEEEWRRSGTDSLLIASHATDFSAALDPNGFIRASAIYNFNSAQGLLSAQTNAYNNAQFLPASNYLSKDISFEAYLANGGLKTYSKTDQPKQSFLWDTGGLHLVANAGHAASNEVFVEDFESSGNNTGGHSGLKSYSGSYTPPFSAPNGRSYKISYWQYVSGAWIYVNNVSYSGQTLSGVIDDVVIKPEDAVVSTYTFKPLVGTTSQTDAKGMTTYYEYDDFGRLRFVKDQDQNIIKSNTYHYKN